MSTSVIGNPKILVINVSASYVCPCQPPPPRSSVKPLHLGSNVRDPYPTDPSQVATLPYLKYEKQRCTGLPFIIERQLQAPPQPHTYPLHRRKNYFLITYQTSDCRHGNNDTDHYYRCYPQASPVSWTVKVDMIVVMSCRLISIVYHGFIHG